MESHHKAGTLMPQVAEELGLPRGVAVLCGGNDAVLAGFSAGLKASRVTPSTSRGPVRSSRSVSIGPSGRGTTIFDATFCRIDG